MDEAESLPGDRAPPSPSLGFNQQRAAREAGQAMRAFFRGGSYSDTAATVGARFQVAFGVTVAEAESAWRARLRT